ncbi:OsmC family protein [Flagellimonas flava]|uniref:Organic hydroperoxide reductase OsmC/OhrA n=1 Tax=Flagellimonas flava TaxID=570519 RepID=A0A1M5I0C9_9FLAO|nr:OsmC family protein [Allomuricauda flava]SHG21685.1 Organic hydroperoxide reductase OsmC/OhrA [Allomuricauda flava]
MKEHTYTIHLKWIGSQEVGTKNYHSYNRDFEITAEGKQHSIAGSSDPSFRGDGTRYNPEDVFVSSLASCHMLWFLHLCSTHNIVVLEYTDNAMGTMTESKDGSGRFKEVTLYPEIVIDQAVDDNLIHELHKRANKMCFIANSCNFPIYHRPKTSTKQNIQ